MKKYIKWTLIIVLLSSFSPNIQSQSFHEKYWWYRYRFRQYFTDIGEGEGKSLVASRHKWRGKNMSLGDQTIKLAWYMGILSLELYQLEDENNEYDNMTLTELYYALQTYKRLDLCENIAPWNQTATHDGFFMRHDVLLTDGYTYGALGPDSPYNFDMSNFNSGIDPSQDNFQSVAPGMPFYVDRFFTYEGDSIYSPDELRMREEMSIDQAAALLMGFTIVKNFAPSGNVWFYNTIEEEYMSFDFHDFVEVNAMKIATHMRDGYTDGNELAPSWLLSLLNLLGPTHPELYGVQNWIVKNPFGNPVGRDGYNARYIRYGVKKAIENITGETFHQETLDGKPIWDFFGAVMDPIVNPQLFFPGPYYNRIIMANLACVGNSWNVIAENPIPGLPDLVIRTTPGVIERLLYMTNPVDPHWETINGIPVFIPGYPAELTNHELLYVLLWSALHITEWEDNFDGIQDRFYIPRIQSILASAPLCGSYNYRGPEDEYNQYETFNFDGCQDCSLPIMAPNGWRAGNRFRNEPSEFTGHDIGNQGIKAGHDYMMLYLLYRKYLMWQNGGHNGYAYFRNMVHSDIDQFYPYEDDGINYGTIENPANLRAFESITYNAEVGNGLNEVGSLNLIAGNRINLTPGFHVYPGSSFTAKIEEYNCFEVSNNKSSFYDNNFIKPVNNDPGAMYQSNYNRVNQTKTSTYQNKTNVIVFPNPASSEIKIISDQLYNNIIFKIYNQQGQFIFDGSLNNNCINVSALANGLYYIEAFNAKGIVFREKFIIKH